MMRFLKKHTWILTAFFAIVLLPQSLTLQSKLDGRIIITGLSIDKIGEKYLVTAQTVSPSSGSIAQGENAGIDFISVETDTIRAGIFELATKVGRTPGLAHLNYVVLGSSLFDENIANVLDFIVREAHTDTSILILVAENAGKEIKKTKDLELGTAITMRKTFLTKQNQSNGVLMVTNEFISNKYNPSSSAIVNYLEIINENESSNEQTSGGSQNSQQSNSSSSNSQQTQTESQNNQSTMTKQARIKYLSPLALFTNGEYKGNLEKTDEIMGYYFASSHSKEIVYGFNQIKYNEVGLAKVTLHCKSKSSTIKCKIENNIPKIKISINLNDNQVVEIISSMPNTLNLYNTQEDYLTSEMKKDIESQIAQYVTATFETCKLKNVDVFNACNKLEKYHKKQFDNYFKTHNLSDFISQAQLEVEVKVGSTIE